MSTLEDELAHIRSTEILLGTPYDFSNKPPDSLRITFALQYGHDYSLLCMGPLALYDIINRTERSPAIAERAVIYRCIEPDGNRYKMPDGETFASIESGASVASADIVAVSIPNPGALPSLFKLLDLAGVPRRAADRTVGEHPLVVGGNFGFANPEPLADYVDVVALGDAEASFLRLIDVVYRGRAERLSKMSLLNQIASIRGLYVPGLYIPDLLPGRGVAAMQTTTSDAPPRVAAAYLSVEQLHRAHFVAPISDGTRAVIVPTLGCRWECHYCTLGVPPFRQAPIELIDDYLKELEQRNIKQIVISSPTFTQYGKRYAVLESIKQYSERSGGHVTTIIGSVRADELSARYLDAVSGLGEFGHLFTELSLNNERGIITIAPEFASEDLVRMYNKTMTRARVNRALDMCRANGNFPNVMLYFMIGAPGETADDRLAIADYAADVFHRLGCSDGVVIVKLMHFVPTVNTVSQRLPMAHPSDVETYVEQIRSKLRRMVGDVSFERNYRVLWGEKSRLLLECVCARGDRRVGHALEALHDAGVDFDNLSPQALDAAMSAHGLSVDEHLRGFEPGEMVPWQVVNEVDPAAEEKLNEQINTRRLPAPI